MPPTERPAPKSSPARVPPPAANARTVAAYYGAVLAASGGNVTKAARMLRSGGAAFVREGDSLRLSNDAAAEAIHAGLRARVVQELADALPLDKAAILRAVGIDKATLARRILKHADLDTAQAEAVLRTMELTTLATETFGTLEKAALWLKRPHPLLEGASPLDYANSQYALAKIKSMLSAIRYGGVV